MKRSFSNNILIILIFTIFCSCTEQEKQLQLLILSGRNNHDWQQTTPVLKRTFEETGIFKVDVTNQPDTLDLNDFRGYDVVVSNWNSWPENDLRWSEETEKGLMGFIKQGGGMVFFHASTSVFYEWPEFKKISTGAWIDETWHGELCPVKVTMEDADHPITNGMKGFWIFDELWFNAEQNIDFKVLGNASKTGEDGYETDPQPALFVSTYGKGRIFHTILGHDARTLRNTGFRSLITRGAEWAATSEVTLLLPQELQKDTATAAHEFHFVETDTTFGLMDRGNIIWQFNYNTFRGKPYFHPVYVSGNRITCVSPDDHRWHLGQWFSWKYINGLNYWEYIGTSYRSEGETDITGIKLVKNPDFSAEIHLDIDYHPQDGETVLKERRKIIVSPPADKSISMDYNMEFEAVADSVDINRTPILGEPDGKSWGGYAGLSIRFNQDLMDASWISSGNDTAGVNGSTGDWLYMGFRGLDGNRTGSAMFVPEQTRRDGWAWYLINDHEIPFYYYSPAYLYLKPLMLSKEEKIILDYRILHLAGEMTGEDLSESYYNYVENLN